MFFFLLWTENNSEKTIGGNFMFFLYFVVLSLVTLYPVTSTDDGRRHAMRPLPNSDFKKNPEGNSVHESCQCLSFSTYVNPMPSTTHSYQFHLHRLLIPYGDYQSTQLQPTAWQPLPFSPCLDPRLGKRSHGCDLGMGHIHPHPPVRPSYAGRVAFRSILTRLGQILGNLNGSTLSKAFVESQNTALKLILYAVV